MSFRYTLCAGVLALCAAALPAQIGIEIDATPGGDVQSNAFAQSYLDLKVAPGAELTILIRTKPHQPFVFAASPRPASGFAIPGIDGLLMIDPKPMIVVVGGITVPRNPVGPADPEGGAKFGLNLPSTLPPDIEVWVQALAGLGGDVAPELGFSQPVRLHHETNG